MGSVRRWVIAIAGALIGGAMNAYGHKPVIPELAKISPDKIQAETIGANLSSLPELERLGAKINAFNSQQQLASIQRSLEFALPGGLGKVQNIVNQQLAGVVPQDVQDQLYSSAAGKALTGGFGGGSGIGRNLTARDFGLTSMGIQQQGLQGFAALAGMMPQTPLFDTTRMFFTPQQRLDFAFQDRNAQFSRDLLYNQVAAAPDPANAALAKEIDRFFNTAASFGMMAAGGAMGGGGMAGGALMGGGGGIGGQGGSSVGGGIGNGQWGSVQSGMYANINNASAQGATIG